MHATLARNHFWKWFNQHHIEFLHLRKKSSKELRYWMDDLEAHLHAYCKKLTFEIKINDEQAVLFISAYANRRYFKKADSLVYKAPDMPGWEIVSLLPRRPIDFRIKEDFGNTNIDPGLLWFTLENNAEENNRPNITIYGEMNDPLQQYYYRKAVHRVVMNLLGERSMGLDIGYMWINTLSEIPTWETPLPIAELPLVIEAQTYSGYEVNANGRLRIRSL